MKIIIEQGRLNRNYWRDIWGYRELLYILAWRDIAVRYKQTAIGIAWALIRPALTMLVFVVFRRLAGLPSAGVPDVILVLAAVLPWQFFSTALTEASGSLVSNANLISKVYFPRIIIPCATVATSFVDLLIASGMLIVLMAWYGVTPSWQCFALPLFVLLTLGFSIGLSLLFAALNVEYRDFRYIVPFLVQIWIFISPIAFTTTNVPEQWRALYALNPLVGIIDGFRWAILGGAAPLDLEAVGVSTAATVAVLVVGMWYFRRMERTFADVI